MISDPKTSPHRKTLQALFGGGVAVTAALLTIAGVGYPLLISLLLANFAFGLYRLVGGSR